MVKVAWRLHVSRLGHNAFLIRRNSDGKCGRSRTRVNEKVNRHSNYSVSIITREATYVRKCKLTSDLKKNGNELLHKTGSSIINTPASSIVE
jgi:hypothetical protein